MTQGCTRNLAVVSRICGGQLSRKSTAMNTRVSTGKPATLVSGSAYSLRKLLITDGKDRHLVVLTPRERSVLRLVSEGCANKEIAIQLSIALRTTEGYVAGIISELGLDNRVMAARWYWIHKKKILRGIPADLGFVDFGPLEA